MQELIDLALQAKAPLPAPLIEAVFAEATADGNRRRMRLLASREDLPYAIRRQLDVAPDADMVARWVATSELTTAELDELIAADKRITVRLAIAARPDLTVEQVRTLADADQAQVAWELSGRKDLDDSVATVLCTTLLKAHAEGRQRPAAADIEKRLASRLRKVALTHPDTPLRVLTLMYVNKLDDASQRVWVDRMREQTLAEIAADTGWKYTNVRGAIGALQQALINRIPGALEASQAVVAACRGVERLPAVADQLGQVVEVFELAGPDPDTAARTVDAETADRLIELIDGQNGDFRSVVMQGLLLNPHISEEAVATLIERQGGRRRETVRLLDEAGLSDRMYQALGHLDSNYRVELLREVDQPASLVVRRAALQLECADDRYHAGAAAARLVGAAATGGLLFEVPVGLLRTALAGKSAPMAHTVLSSIYSQLGSLDAWRTALTLADEFDGTVREMVETANALS